jgi:uncharacterized membrane protein YcaP (DUF421 family)
VPTWLFHGWAEDGVAAAKAAGMYAVALVGLRLAPRRTLSQWTAIDVAAAVALGAIIGRTAIAGDQSLAVGAAALTAILVANYLAALCRFNSRIAGLVDHRVKVLVDHGKLRPRQLRRCGLIEDEVLAYLRRNGVASLSDVRYVLYESKGELTIVPEHGPQEPDSDLVRIALRQVPDPQGRSASDPGVTGTGPGTP